MESLDSAVDLLRKLISIKSFSGEENMRKEFLVNYFKEMGISSECIGNNIIIKQKHHNESLPTLMLNSHLDTVQPASGYTIDPYNPEKSDKYVYGLGSNDAGASVVSMIHAFIHLKDVQLGFNLMLVLSAEEENSGPNGMTMIWQRISSLVDMAIIGEPTGMRAAIAERGLLVIDGLASGVSGHAARDEGVNALYIALNDIYVLRTTNFSKVSPTMGEVKLTVTQINAGTQHNVVPDKCSFVVDIRPTEQYSNSEIMDILQPKVKSLLKARSLTNKSSATPPNHSLLKCIERLGIESYTSPTTSDWMRVSCPAIKMGPGESARSHQADEFVLIDEIDQGIKGYINYLTELSRNS